jgi:hypothetical protein
MATKKTIVVVGDVTLDWLQEEIPRSQTGRTGEQHNYELYSGFRWTPVWGGAALVERLLKAALAAKKHGLRAAFAFEGVGKRLPRAITGGARKYLQSLAIVKQMVKDEGEPIRVDPFRGFTADPAMGTAVAPFPTEISSVDCIVVDDAANGCRDDNTFVSNLTRLCAQAPLVVIKLSRPLNRSVLMTALVNSSPAQAQRTVIIVNADDLRAQGLDISRRLSWERSAIDLLSTASASSILSHLSSVGDVLVRFGNDGCIVLERGGPHYLVFDPHRAEDTYDQQLSGTMPGATSAFTADVTAILLYGKSLRDAVPQALCASRKVLKHGFVRSKTSTKQLLDYPLAVFSKIDHITDDFKTIDLPANGENSKDWSILSATLEQGSLDRIAREIVREGHERHLKGVPVAEFGKLLLIDRREIEGYRSIDNLLREYIKGRHGGKPRPLSIGVFGPPGSGKSFGINEIAGSITETQIKSLPFNLTQFEGPADLVGAFHTARDESLKGNLPLLIFDEFDCPIGAEPWGWLKFFLAPMQDGEFIDSGRIHPLGRAIFVFAGGIAHCFEQFSAASATVNSMPSTESNSKPSVDSDFEQSTESTPAASADVKLKNDFKNAKGPDFASRLKGYVDVVGINPASTEGLKDSELEHVKVDPVCIVRRAFLLRSLLLGQEHRTRNMNPITNGRNRFDIDDAVLDALLKVKRYRHGARSLESILIMSRLTDRDHFGLASLPSNEQLKIHVDDSFGKILKERSDDR